MDYDISSVKVHFMLDYSKLIKKYVVIQDIKRESEAPI
jgi:hypothetical protein